MCCRVAHWVTGFAAYCNTLQRTATLCNTHTASPSCLVLWKDAMIMCVCVAVCVYCSVRALHCVCVAQCVCRNVCALQCACIAMCVCCGVYVLQCVSVAVCMCCSACVLQRVCFAHETLCFTRNKAPHLLITRSSFGILALENAFSELNISIWRTNSPMPRMHATIWSFSIRE